MSKPPETITVQTSSLYCDGIASGDAGHPRVFLTMSASGSVDCPYCGRHYVLDANAKKVAAH